MLSVMRQLVGVYWETVQDFGWEEEDPRWRKERVSFGGKGVLGNAGDHLQNDFPWENRGGETIATSA